jgi:hypothetical protein
MPMNVVKPYSIVIMQFWQLVCASLLVLTVASCKKESTIAPPTTSTPPVGKEVPVPTTSTPPVGKEVPAKIASTSPVEIEVPAPKSKVIGATEKSKSLTDLQVILSSTKKAIVAGKLAEAKTEFAAFETTWKTIGSDVMSKSPDRYQAIESGVKSVESGINNNLGKDALLASVEKLSQNIDIARK